MGRSGTQLDAVGRSGTPWDAVGAGLAAHVLLRIAVGARRDERRRDLLVPILSRPDERRVAVLRSGERPAGRRVTAARRRGGEASGRGGGSGEQRQWQRGGGGWGGGRYAGCRGHICGGGGTFKKIQYWHRRMRLVESSRGKLGGFVGLEF